MYYRILGTSTIQLSSSFIDGYKTVIVDDKPVFDCMTQHIEVFYQVIEGEVHQSWKVVNGESELSDSEALEILTGLQ